MNYWNPRNAFLYRGIKRVAVRLTKCSRFSQLAFPLDIIDITHRRHLRFLASQYDISAISCIVCSQIFLRDKYETWYKSAVVTERPSHVLRDALHEIENTRSYHQNNINLLPNAIFDANFCAYGRSGYPRGN